MSVEHQFATMGQQPGGVQALQQVSFHFWSCQLTEASPKYQWEPESGSAASRGDQRPKRQVGRHDQHQNGNAAEEAQEAVTNGDKNGHKVEEDANGDAGMNEADSDFIQHVLKVNACILGPKAAGVHLIAVRTKCFGQTEPDACPIVCVDPDSQRTVSLGYEFVLDSQNEVTFELVEGAGPVWLTGLHQVRVHDPDEGDEEAEACDESIDEEAADVDGSVDLNEEDEDDEEAEDEQDEDDEEEEEEEEARPVAKRVARASKTDQQRPVVSPKKAAAKRGGGRAARKT